MGKIQHYKDDLELAGTYYLVKAGDDFGWVTPGKTPTIRTYVIYWSTTAKQYKCFTSAHDGSTFTINEFIRWHREEWVDTFKSIKRHDSKTCETCRRGAWHFVPERT